MKKIIAFLLLFTVKIIAQNDCSDAISVCGSSGYNDLEASGVGAQELNGSNNCSSEENNSIWFKLIIKTGGTLGFTLTPNSSDINEDFDFFIFGPNATCNNLGFAIRCSTTNPAAANQGNNLTGMNNTETDTSEGPGENGNSFVKQLNVNAGDTYFLVIDRPIGNSNFKLEWTGTATFSDPPVVETSPTVNNTLNLEQCDSDNDQTATFDLSVNDVVINGQANVAATYHTSNNDAILGINPIQDTSNYTNKKNPETVYIRLTNTSTGCFSIDEFTLTVNENAKAKKPLDYKVCDDVSSGSDTDGIYTNFILNSKDSEVLGSLNANDYTISYHSSLNGANSNTDIIDKNSSYANTTANEQIIYIRFQNKKKPDCFDTSQSFKLIVNPLPTINNLIELKQCDNDTDGITKFNLNETKRLLSDDFNELTFNFYTNKLDAENNNTSNQITTIESYENTQVSGESVWVTISNQNGCSRIAEIQLTVSTTQIPSNFKITYNQCDDAGNNNSYDGITSFDFSDATQKIRNLFPSNQELIISFYEKEDDALAENNAITNLDSFRNTNSPNKQDIFVRVDTEANNACIGLGTYIQLIANPPPSFSVISPQLICINNPNTTLQVDNPKENYNYKWTKNDETTIISTTATLNVISGGNYHVTATNPITNCSLTRTITVNESQNPLFTESDIIIKDDSDNKSIQFNESSNTDILDYVFALQNGDGQLIRNYQSEPNFNNLSGGIYTLLVKDKICSGITKIDVPLVGFPTFFTPNNDGYNDYWKVQGVNSTLFPKSSLTIFNRQGKIITQLSLDDKGWDGLYNGKILPSNDYWFKIELTNRIGETKTKTGHFSLLRK